jgi:hypothetical protein
MYDKAGSVLRVETTIARTTDFKVLRPAHDQPDGKLQWRPLRKGVADLHRRAQLSQRSNEAYLEALSAVEDTTPGAKLFDAVSRPVVEDGRRFRALRLSDPSDLALLAAVSRGEFAPAGFRNRDIRGQIYSRGNGASSPSPVQASNPATSLTVPPGHDSRVVGDEPYVSLHLLGGEAFARGR